MVAQKHYKVIMSGGIIEVYEFEKLPPTKRLKEVEDGYDPLDLENTKLELSKEDRTLERRQQTVRDARNTTRRLALMNFGPGDTFFTMTYAENMQDLEQADKDFKKFIQRFKYHHGDFKYLAVREFQKRGAIHYHMLCSWTRAFEGEEDIRSWERYFGEQLWGHGFVDIKFLNHVDNVGAYLIKYMTKNLSIELFKGKKVYLPSKGLERPEVFRGDQAEELIRFYGLETKKKYSLTPTKVNTAEILYTKSIT